MFQSDATHEAAPRVRTCHSTRRSYWTVLKIEHWSCACLAALTKWLISMQCASACYTKLCSLAWAMKHSFVCSSHVCTHAVTAVALFGPLDTVLFYNYASNYVLGTSLSLGLYGWACYVMPLGNEAFLLLIESRLQAWDNGSPIWVVLFSNWYGTSPGIYWIQWWLIM